LEEVFKKIMIEELLAEATKQLKNSYTPYSNFKVGAAVLTDDDQIYGGCNIENISFSPTVCAERCAIFSAIAGSHQHFKALLVTGNTDEVIKPCGVCRQVINEFFDPETPIYLTNQNGKIEETTITQLLPGSFSDLN
jgi:cytidine deaminase